MRRILIAIVPVVLAILLQLPAPSLNKLHPQQDAKSNQGNASRDRKDSTRSTTIGGNKLVGQEKSTNNEDRPDNEFAAWVTAVSTLVYAIAAIFTWLAIKRQGGYMLKALAEAKKSAEAATLSAETAKDALHLSERADVLFGDVSASDGPHITMGTTVNVAVKNYGRTRAADLTISAYMLAFDNHRSVPTDEQRMGQAGIGFGTPRVVGPSEELLFPFGPVMHMLEPDEVRDIAAGTKQCWLEVSFCYIDVFGEGHTVIGRGVFRGDPEGRFVMDVSTSP